MHKDVVVDYNLKQIPTLKLEKFEGEKREDLI